MDFETSSLLAREVDGIIIVILLASDLTTTPVLDQIAAEINALLEKNALRLVIDFKYVRYTCEALLTFLLALQKEIELVGGKLVLSHTQAFGEPLRQSGALRRFAIAATIREARAFFTA